MSTEHTIMPGEPVNQQIYRFLRHEIVNCIIHPGSLLSEKDVSVRFNVSRQPVREAFIKLAEAGLILVLPQRGTFVRKISVQRVEDGRFIREAVEVAVTRRAALEASATGLAALEHNLQLQQLAAERHDSTTFMELDDEFHRLIAKSIQCDLAWETVENIKASMDRVRFLTLSEVSPPEHLIEQHWRIYQALCAKDADAAEKAIRSHLQEMITSIAPVTQQNRDWFDME